MPPWFSNAASEESSQQSWDLTVPSWYFTYSGWKTSKRGCRMCFKGHKLLSSCWENKKVVLCCCAQQIDLDCYQEYWTGIWVRFTRKVAQPLYFLSVRRRNAKSGVPQNTGCEVVGTVRCWRSYCSLDREQGFIRRRLQPQNQLRRTVLRLLKQVCI